MRSGPQTEPFFLASERLQNGCRPVPRSIFFWRAKPCHFVPLSPLAAKHLFLTGQKRTKVDTQLQLSAPTNRPDD